MTTEEFQVVVLERLDAMERSGNEAHEAIGTRIGGLEKSLDGRFDRLERKLDIVARNVKMSARDQGELAALTPR